MHTNALLDQCLSDNSLVFVGKVERVPHNTTEIIIGHGQPTEYTIHLDSFLFKPASQNQFLSKSTSTISLTGQNFMWPGDLPYSADTKYFVVLSTGITTPPRYKIDCVMPAPRSALPQAKNLQSLEQTLITEYVEQFNTSTSSTTKYLIEEMLTPIMTSHSSDWLIERAKSSNSTVRIRALITLAIETNDQRFLDGLREEVKAEWKQGLGPRDQRTGWFPMYKYAYSTNPSERIKALPLFRIIGDETMGDARWFELGLMPMMDIGEEQDIERLWIGAQSSGRSGGGAYRRIAHLLNVSLQNCKFPFSSPNKPLDCYEKTLWPAVEKSGVNADRISKKLKKAGPLEILNAQLESQQLRDRYTDLFYATLQWGDPLKAYSVLKELRRRFPSDSDYARNCQRLVDVIKRDPSITSGDRNIEYLNPTFCR